MMQGAVSCSITQQDCLIVLMLHYRETECKSFTFMHEGEPLCWWVQYTSAGDSFITSQSTRAGIIQHIH